jgi:polyisoprenoid-binding protein YceI
MRGIFRIFTAAISMPSKPAALLAPIAAPAAIRRPRRRFRPAIDRRHLRFALLLGAIAAPLQAAAEAADYELDPEHLTIAFLVDHVGFAKVLGQFLSAEGSFRFDEQTGELSELIVTVDTDSVTTQHRDRDRHLRGGDFLNSSRYPQMIFRAGGARRIDDRTFEIDGELTLIGQARPLSLVATLNKSGEYPFGPDAYVLGVSARGSFKRSDFGMTYGVENGWVGDDVEILIEFEAQRQ